MIALYVNGNSGKYFESFGIEQVSKEIKKNIGNKNIITNILRIQTCGYFCIGFIVFQFKGESLADFTNFFSTHSDNTVPNYFLEIKYKDARNLLCVTPNKFICN